MQYLHWPSDECTCHERSRSHIKRLITQKGLTDYDTTIHPERSTLHLYLDNGDEVVAHDE
jgi:hypothetical protein